MKNQLKNVKGYTNTLVALSFITIVFGALTALFGEIAAPLYAASLAALYLYDTRSRRVLSIVVSLFVVGLNLILGNYVPTAAVFAVFAALVISLMYNRGMSKGECFGYVTVINAVMILVGLFALACLSTKSLSFEAVFDYYGAIYEGIVGNIIKAINEAAVTASSSGITQSFDEETIRTLLDAVVLVLPSVLVIVAFLLSGITAKIFTFIVSRLSAKPLEVLRWRFSTGNVFAYFYLIVSVLAFVAMGNDGFAIVVANLHNVFMVVYAYIGFNYVHFLISRSRSSFFATAILIVAILALSSFALSLLSFIGVYFTIMKNKSISKDNGTGVDS